MSNEIETKSKNKKKIIIGVQIDYDIYEQIKQYAEERFVSMSDITRAIIYKYFKEETTKMKGKINNGK